MYFIFLLIFPAKRFNLQLTMYHVNNDENFNPQIIIINNYLYFRSFTPVFHHFNHTQTSNKELQSTRSVVGH